MGQAMDVAGPYDQTTPLGSGVPLGGVEPGPPPADPPQPVRHLVLALILLIAAVVAAWSSTMPWSDPAWHRPNGVIPTGWTRYEGALGRGWVTMSVAVLIAGSGLLIATYSERLGRIVAVISGITLMALATIEWGIAGATDLDGPGMGLWVQLMTGVAVVLAVGIVTPLDAASRART